MDDVKKEVVPFRFARWIATYPKTVMACVYLVCVVCGGIIAATDSFSLTQQSTRDFMITNDLRTETQDSYTMARTALRDDSVDASLVIPERNDVVGAWSLAVLYHAKDTDNLFTPSFISLMSKVEKYITDDTDWPILCKLLNNTCDPLQSRISIVPMLEGKDQAAIDQALAFVADNDNFRVFFDREFSSTNLKSRYVRSVFQFGAPLGASVPGGPFKNSTDRFDEQEAAWFKLVDRFEDSLAKQEWKDGPMDVWVTSGALTGRAFDDVTNGDFLWTAASFVFVLFYAWFHMQSFFLAGLGMLQIILSFLPSYFLYRIVMQIKFFQSVHILAVFIILGIGADNMFVFVDAWNQAGLQMPHIKDDLVLRMSWTYRRAGHASLVTSLTTMAAFLATGISVIRPIASFGLFAACLIFVNYVLDITIFPACIIIWHRTFRSWSLLRCFRHSVVPTANSPAAPPPPIPPYSPKAAAATASARGDGGDGGDGGGGGATASACDGGGGGGGDDVVVPSLPVSGVVVTADGDSDKDAQGNNDATTATTSGDSGAVASGVPASPTSAVGGEDGDGVHGVVVVEEKEKDETIKEVYQPHQEELRFVERIFVYKWTPFTMKFRYVILFVFLAWFVVAVYFAAQIKPLSKQEEWFPEWHPVAKVLDAITNHFKQSENDRTITVRMFWGVLGINRDGTDPFNSKDYGVAVWDTSFDLSSPASQLHLYSLCQTLRNSSLVLAGGNVKCFIEDYRQWRLSEAAREGGVVDDAFPAVFSTNVDEQKTQFLSSLRAFAAVVAYQLKWVRNQNIGFSGDNSALKFIEFSATAALRPGLPRADTYPVYEQWQQFIDDQNAAATSQNLVGVNKGLQTAGVSWQWMQTEAQFVQNVIQGMAISISVAFVILVLSTKNFFVGSFATLTIIGIIASVVAIMHLLGWELGVSESISSVILIGFSVDYVVHLSNAYVESSEHTRYDRTKCALRDMGISVVAGGATTMGSGVFLWGCTLIFFTKFAILIVSTIGFSLVWSLGFFVALCHVVGPQGQTGSLVRLYRMIIPSKPAKAADTAAAPPV